MGDTFSNLLRSELRQRQRVNENYSLRAFARYLGLSPSFLSKLMAGKRVGSQDTFLKVSARLKLSDGQIAKLATRSARVVDSENEAIKVDEFRLIADWHHFAILECTKLEDFEASPDWIARRLTITEERAAAALERLERLGLITFENGRIVKAAKNYTNFSPNGPTPANTEHERQILEGAIEALAKVPARERYQTSVTMAIPFSRLEEARARLRKFRDGLMASLQRPGRRDSVYQLSMSLYPVTKTKTNEENS